MPIEPAVTAVVPVLRKFSAIAESFADPMVFLDKYRKTTLQNGFPAELMEDADQLVNGSAETIS